MFSVAAEIGNPRATIDIASPMAAVACKRKVVI
jgi:hypothetical protein